MAKTQFETLIEHIINDEEDAARELLHDIVVQTSRKIYNEMAAEDEELEEAGGDMTDDMIDDVEADEEGMDVDMDGAGDELGDEMGVDAGDDMGGDMDMDVDAGDDMGDDMGGDLEGEGELEDRVVDLEAALDELKAEFDQLMSQEEGEPEHMDDMGGDMDMEIDAGEEMPKEGVVREYVEKVKDFYKGDNSEGKTVGTGSSDKPSVNAKSIVDNMKNDMGGTTKNIVKGGSESAPDGNTAYKKPNNIYAKGFKDSEYASRNVNQVGGNKGASDFYGTKAKAPKTSEESGTNDKSILKKI